MNERQRERQKRAQLESEMASLYRELWALKDQLGEAPRCPDCERRERMERIRQGAGIDWEKFEEDRPSMIGNNRGDAQ